MRYVINIVLFLAICGLVYTLVNNIKEPIDFKNQYDAREAVVTDRLKSIRAAQDVFRQVQGEGYAPTFDSLIQVLQEDSIMTISVLGNPDDPNDPTITYDTSYTAAMDRIAELNKINDFKIDLDSLPYVPYSDGKKFEITADTITYQLTLVNVLEVKTKISNYMGKYASPKYARYDASYNPNGYIKFGDMNSPNLTGNWE